MPEYPDSEISVSLTDGLLAPRRSRVQTTAGPAGLPFRFAVTVLNAGLTQADSTLAVESCKAWRELQSMTHPNDLEHFVA